MSAAFLRPGQDGNITWLSTVLAATGVFPDARVVRGRPYTWDVWLRARGTPAAECVYTGAFVDYDLVVGFELSSSAKVAARHWVDVRFHPYRWSRVVWSVETSFSFTFPRVDMPRPEWVPKRGPWETCFTTQVSSDATLLMGHSLITADDARTTLEKVASEHKVFHVVPHPLEQEGPWVAMALALPNAKLWTRTAYEALAEHQSMWTINSSTGYEAPHFGCGANFLGPRHKFSHPYDVSDKAFWTALRAAAEEATK